MKSSSYCSSSSVYWIPTTSFFTVIDAPVARRTIIIVGGISRSTKLKLLASIDWRQPKLFDAPQSTREKSDKFFVTSNVKVMRDTSSPGAETRRDCVSGAAFVKRFSNSLDVAGSVGRSTPTDPVHFLMVRLAVVSLQQLRTLVLQFFWLVDGRCAQHRGVLNGGYGIHMRSVPSYDSDGI